MSEENLSHQAVDHSDDEASTCSATSALPEMPLLPITNLETVQACKNLAVTDHDIFVCSYPKSGTTWTQNLVVRLLASHVGVSLPEDWHLSHSAPFYEVNQYWKEPLKGCDPTTTLERVPAKTHIQGPAAGIDKTIYRIFNTHLRPHQLPPNAKCVYVMRDPMDVLVSFYHHLVNQSEEDGGYNGTMHDFCVDFMNGTVLYGKWEDHMEAWLKYYFNGSGGTEVDGAKTILLLHYEDMKEDLNKEATRLAKFLGVEDERLEDVVNTAVSHCTFEAMKKEQWRYTPQSVSWKVDPKTGKAYDKFVRQGRIGDGQDVLKNSFTQDLKMQWLNNIKRAIKRWKKTGIDRAIIERYLTLNEMGV